jgi:hypothetical protein
MRRRRPDRRGDYPGSRGQIRADCFGEERGVISNERVLTSHCWAKPAAAPGVDRKISPEKPIAGVGNVRERWMNTNTIDLVVDGEIVDLNRIPLPVDCLIVDERFAKDRGKP